MESQTMKYWGDMLWQIIETSSFKVVLTILVILIVFSKYIKAPLIKNVYYIFKNSSINKFNTEKGKIKNKQKDANDIAIALGSSKDKQVPSLLKAAAIKSKQRREQNGTVKQNRNNEIESKSSTTDTSESSTETPPSSPYLTSTDCEESTCKSKDKGPKKVELVCEDSNIDTRNEESGHATEDRSSSEKSACKKKRRRKKKVTKSHLRNIQSWIEDGHHHCSVREHGGIVELPFVTAHFPSDAVKKEKRLRFTQVQCQDDSTSIVLLQPIHCSCLEKSGAVIFHREVKFKIKIAQSERRKLFSGAEAEIQVTECSVNIRWVTWKKLTMTGADESISFKIRRFAGFRVVVRNPSEASLQKTLRENTKQLFYTLCVQRFPESPDPFQHYLFVVVHCEAMCKEVKEYLDRKDVGIVTPKRILSVTAPCTLKATVTVSTSNARASDILPGSTREYHLKKLKEPVMEYLCIELKKRRRDISVAPEESILLNFTIRLFGAENIEKFCHCPFQWTLQNDTQSTSPPMNQNSHGLVSPQQPAPMTINVYDGGVGVKYIGEASHDGGISWQRHQH